MTTQNARRRAAEQFQTYLSRLEAGRGGDGAAPRELVLELLRDGAGCEHWASLGAACLYARTTSDPTDPYRYHLDDVVAWLDSDLTDDDLRALAGGEQGGCPMTLHVEWSDGRTEQLAVQAGAVVHVGDPGAADTFETWLHSDADTDAVRVTVHGSECPLLVLRGGEAMNDDAGGGSR